MSDGPMEFSRRPIRVDAMRISSPAAAKAIEEWSGGVAKIDKPWKLYRESMDVTTPDGVVGAWPGCWVIRYSDGTFHVVESDAEFFAEFEPGAA